jgi:acetyl-CoA C-acetyltransferase
MASLHSVVIAEPVRTAIGTFGGTLKDVPAVDLGAVAINAAIQRAGLQPHDVGTVVMGNAVQAGNKMNPARQAAIHAGLPVQVPAMTVNRVCGSGAQAIVSAAQEILMGSVDAAVAGGMENMDAAPYLLARGRWGHRLGDGVLYDSVLRDGLNDAFCALGLAYRGSGNEVSDRSRRSGRMGAALTSALLRRAGHR